MKRFCPKCGASITKGTFCEDCARKETKYIAPLVQISEFNRVFEQGRWKIFEDLDTVIIRRVKQSLKRSDIFVEVEPFEFAPQPKEKTVIYVKAHIDKQVIRLPVKLSYRQCDFGQKQKTGYFEGILQLRHPHEAVTKFIEQELQKSAHKGVFITKVSEQKNGVDLYFTKKTFMKLLSEKLVSKFGGKSSLNPQLFSHNHETSRDIYRLNIVVEFPKFILGDCVMFKPVHARSVAEPIVVKIISLGRFMGAINLSNAKKISFELKYTKDLEKLKQHKTQISSTQPRLAILDPQSYQEEEVNNTKALSFEYEAGDDVMIVKTPYGIYIVE